jgi:small-conductance mechanosensitive channel
MRVRVGFFGKAGQPCALPILAALVMLLLAGDRAALAQAGTEPSIVLTLRGDETPEALKRTLDALEAGGRKVTLRIAGAGEATPTAGAVQATAPTSAVPIPSAAAAATPKQGSSRLDTFWDDFVAGFDYGNEAIPAAAALPEDWSRAWAGNRNGLSGLPAAVRLLLVLALATAAAALFRRASAGWFSRRLVPGGSEFTSRLMASAYGLLQDAVTLGIALVILRVCGNLALPESDLAASTLRTIGNGAVIGAAYVMVGRFLLAPGAPERRLMPLPRAERHFRILVCYAISAPVVIVGVILAQRVAASQMTVAGLFATTALAITLFKLWWFFDARHDLTRLVLRNAEAPSPGLRVLALLTPWFYMAVAIVIWMVGRAAAMMSDGARWAEAAGITQIVVVLAPVIAVGIGNLIRCRRAHRAAVAETTPHGEALSRAGEAAATGIVWAGAFYLLARLWAGFAFDMASPEFSAFSRQAAGVAILLFAGWVALVFLRAFFDAYAPRQAASGPADEDAAPVEGHVPSRLATVLPVLRGVVLGAVAGLVGLVVLSRLGVDIGPLLAGFGILGLAISFGSQALVRDIVSGFFFMIEDAFRVGEYVDTGRLKGTVEKISLRSMQLRHQSGQIHTVPFGQIPSLTNASRDWATLKFNVRLDHSADIEKARKTIKKVGLALLEDPEFAPHFISQLKMQGVADITDSAVVIRLKFTAKPAHASTLQREALKRVYRALNEAGVPFASNAVTVRGGEGQASAGAAAITAVPPPTPLAPAAG